MFGPCASTVLKCFAGDFIHLPKFDRLRICKLTLTREVSDSVLVAQRLQLRRACLARPNSRPPLLAQLRAVVVQARALSLHRHRRLRV